MKAIKLPKEIQSFLDVAEAAEEETLVFTKKNRPVGRFGLAQKGGPRVVGVEHQSAVLENH